MFKKIDFLQALTQLLFGILGALLVQLTFLHFSSKIITVDIAGIVKSFEDEVSKQKLPPDALTKIVTRFSDSLNSTVDDYARQKHSILVPKGVVIAGVTDKTDEVKELIKKRMKI